MKRIFFDIDDTLFPSSQFAEKARKNAVRAMVEQGLGYREDEVYSKLLKIIRKKGSNYPRHFDLLCRELGVKRPARYIAAAIAGYHSTKTGILPYPEVKKVLSLLKKKGYKLYVATNGSSLKQWDKLIILGLAPYFEDVFVSEEIGSEKSAAFFRKILKKLRERPGNCVMVGDREEKDIFPAKKAGMATVRVLRGKYRSGKSAADFRVRNLKPLRDMIKKL
jgi:putative hydrolase of the HAD superfamily